MTAQDEKLTIELEHRLNPEEVTKFLYRMILRSWGIWLFAIICLIMILEGMFIVALPIAGFYAFAMFLGPLLFFRKRFVENRDIFDEPVCYIFAKDGLYMESQSSSSRTDWKHYSKVCETNSMIILYTAKLPIVFFPKQALQEAGKLEALKETLSAHLPPKSCRFIKRS